MIRISALFAAVSLSVFGGISNATTLGWPNGAPTIDATGSVNFLELGTDGDLSLFGAPVSGSSHTSLDIASAELSFVVGFDLVDPRNDASGGVLILDSFGEYLRGELQALVYPGVGAFDGSVELYFGKIVGRGKPEWPERLLMNIAFEDASDPPFQSFFDGDSYGVEIGISAVYGAGPKTSEIPLPAAWWLLVCALSLLFSQKRRARMSE